MLRQPPHIMVVVLVFALLGLAIPTALASERTRSLLGDENADEDQPCSADLSEITSCLEAAGFSMGSLMGGQMPDESGISCGRDCNKDAFPQGCLDEDVPEDGLTLDSIQLAYEYFDVTCSVPTIPVDPDSGVEPAFDFDHCTTTYGSSSSSSCNIGKGLAFISTLNDFRQCTDWNGLDLIASLLDGEASFGQLISSCGGFDDITTDPEGCLHAIHEASEDTDNPLHEYISDIYDDPDKYCGCNKDMLGSLPQCMYNGIYGAIDTNDALLASCLINEFCQEIETTCKTIGNKIEDCVDHAMGELGSDVNCAESCHDFELPTGCMRHAIEGDLEAKLLSYDAACEESGGEEEGEEEGDEEEEEEEEEETR